MKSSYKLIGLIWDHKPSYVQHLPVKHSNIEAPSYLSEPCIFDLISNKRYIELSALLDVESESQLRDIAYLLADCDELEVRRDYKPTSTNKTHWDYYELRVQQCLTTLCQYLPNTTIYFSDCKESMYDTNTD